jgi:hypothetical protein
MSDEMKDLPVEVPTEKLNELDHMSLELAKSREQTARAQYESAVLGTRTFVLQIYMKYGLTADDLIKEDGTIVRGGALTQQGK